MSEVFRLLDFVLALAGLFFSLPVLLVSYLIGLFDTDSPLFFQVRVGLNKKPFILIKLRTMKVDTASVASHMASVSSIAH